MNTNTTRTVKKKIVRKKIITKIIKRPKEDDDVEESNTVKPTEELPRSILAIGKGSAYMSSDDDTNSSSSESEVRTRQLTNRDMLGSFIKQRSDCFIEPEPTIGTGVMSDMQNAFDSREQRETLTTKQPSPFLGFSNAMLSPQHKAIALSLPMDKQYPKWIEANSPLNRLSGISLDPVSALHSELKEFCSYMQLSKPSKKKLLSTGKATLSILQSSFSNLEGTLVGSLASRLYNKNSTVDLAVWGTEITIEDIKETFKDNDSYTYLREESGALPLVVLEHVDGVVVKIILSEAASKTADFIAQMQGLYQNRLFMLSVVLNEMLRQRGIRGRLTPHVITLITISYLNGRAWSGEENDNYAVLLLDFLRFLTYRFNSFTGCLNPKDVTGHVVQKSSLVGVVPAPAHHLHVIDPISGHNTASYCFNWAVCREICEHSIQMLSLPWPPESIVDHHAMHPQAMLRSTLLSRILNTDKM